MIITNAISNFVLFIYAHAGIFAPAIAGAIMPMAVIAGVHLRLFPIATLMITDVGFDPIVHPALMVYNMSIAGASFAYGLKWGDDVIVVTDDKGHAVTFADPGPVKMGQSILK